MQKLMILPLLILFLCVFQSAKSYAVSCKTAEECTQKAKELGKKCGITNIMLSGGRNPKGCPSDPDKKRLKFYQKALEYDPSSVEALTEVGELYYKKTKYADAIGLWTAAVTLVPDNCILYTRLRAAYESWNSEDGNIPDETLCKKGDVLAVKCFADKGNWDQAEQTLVKEKVGYEAFDFPMSADEEEAFQAVRLYHKNKLAEKYAVEEKQWEKEKAIEEEKEKALALEEKKGKEAQEYSAQAARRCKKGDYEGALKAHAKSIKISKGLEDQYKYYVARAETYASMGAFDRARRDYDSARKAAPPSLENEALERFKRTYGRLVGEKKQAEQEIRKRCFGGRSPMDRAVRKGAGQEVFEKLYPGSHISCLDGSGTLLKSGYEMLARDGTVYRLSWHADNGLDYVVSFQGRTMRERISDGHNYVVFSLDDYEDPASTEFVDARLPIVVEEAEVLLGRQKAISLRGNSLIGLLNSYYSQSLLSKISEKLMHGPLFSTV